MNDEPCETFLVFFRENVTSVLPANPRQGLPKAWGELRNGASRGGWRLALDIVMCQKCKRRRFVLRLAHPKSKVSDSVFQPAVSDGAG